MIQDESEKIITVTIINVNAIPTKDTKHYSNQLLNYLISLYNIDSLVYIINTICATDKLSST